MAADSTGPRAAVASRPQRPFGAALTGLSQARTIAAMEVSMQRTLTALAPRRSLLLLLGVAVSGALAGCGTTSVQMLVTRPAVFNAQQFGGTVGVAGFVSQNPALVQVANTFRVDVEQQILAGHGGVVRLTHGGAGLMITGRVDEYGLALQTEEEDAQCDRRVRVEQGGKTETRTVRQACKRYRVRWAARMLALVRITSAQGQTVFLRQLLEQDTGITPWNDDEVPQVPNAAGRLAKVKLALAQQVAWLVVPHRERVTATLYDCPEPAAKTCDQGARALAASDYDGSLRLYQQAIDMLKNKPGLPPSEIAEIHWNRAIVAKYGRMFGLAVQELQAALRLEDSGTYRRELEAVQRAAVEHEQLIDQGLGGQ